MKTVCIVMCVVVSVAALSAVVVGCGDDHKRVVVVREQAPAPVYAPVQGPSYVIVNRPPPPPMVEREVRPHAPGKDFIWVPGYWHWNGRDYVWTRGHWERAPHAKAVWVPAHYEKKHNGWAYIPGHWEKK